jgi:DNA-binding response OmpR family regulator
VKSLPPFDNAPLPPPPPAEPGPPRRKAFNVLVVDDEPEIRQLLDDALSSPSLHIRQAGSLTEARGLMEVQPVDLVLVDVKLPDGCGVELAEEIRHRRGGVQSIVMTGRPSLDRAVQAIRAGACDFLAKPLDLSHLNKCVDKALERRSDLKRADLKVRKLRKLCKKLNQARHEVTQQVDILCNDLVTAYQELAGQMKHVQITTQFKASIEQELDLEQLLRRVLEFVLQQVGPTNAVIFMPSPSGGFTTGGYINYSFDKQTADVLLSHLADVAAPRIAEAKDPLHFTDDADIHLWLSDDSAWLANSHVIGLPCRNDGETLASVLLFRDSSEPFDSETVGMLNSVATIFASHLVKVINIHHRHEDDDEDEGEDDGGNVPF